MAAMTPTQKGSMLAGIGVWTLLWATLFKLDKIPLLSRFVSKERTLRWVNQNKTITLLATEILNFGVHGVAKPESVLFALGGTVTNFFTIFVLIPFRQMRRDKDQSRNLLKGRAA